MSNLSNALCLVTLASLSSTSTYAQVSTPEVEPNGDKFEASVFTGMDAGDDLTGACLGNVNGSGNMASDSTDYWDISTAPQATPGWYRWTLAVTPGNDLEIRALDTAGSTGTGSVGVVGSDDYAQGDSNDEIHWYSNETASRIYVRLTGSSTSAAAYSASLSVTPILDTSVVGSFLPGMITISTVGQTSDDTDISIADSSRTIIPSFLNDDRPGTTQSELTRSYPAGTYYLVVCDFDQNNSEGAAVDDNYVNGEIMDFPNAFVASSTSVGDNLTFLIDDGQGTQVVTPANKSLVHGIEFFRFTVGLGGSSAICVGDGGNQTGCTSCPCGNQAPAGSSGGCLNSTGRGARLIPSGSPSVSLPLGSTQDLRFDAEDLPPLTFCVLSAGDVLAPESMAHPCFGLGFGATDLAFDGLRCVSTNTRLHGGRRTDAQGEVGVTNSSWGGAGAPPAGIAQRFGYVAGQTRYFQLIHRENALSVCARGLNTSQAVGIGFTP